MVGPVAGANVPAVRARGDGRADGAVGAATFANPNTRVPLRFDEGTHRLVGAVVLGDGPARPGNPPPPVPQPFPPNPFPPPTS